ncbi:hypothetical protein H4217_005451 [Coemansia sp. RSA 1939]|nr:hypothetical protein H4217_005451 [Coemansia sp. RSA 1939]
MDSSVLAVVAQGMKCIPRPTAAAGSTVVEAYEPPRIVHPAVTTSKEYESVATLSTAFTLSEPETESASISSSSSSEEEAGELAIYETEEGMAPADIAAARSAQILCLDKQCTRNRDWLTRMPNAAAGWATGGVILALAIVLFVPTVVWRNTDYLDGVFALVELSIALFLRASVASAGSSNRDIVYKASLFFNHHTGIQLSLLLATMVIRMYGHFKPGRSQMAHKVWVSVARFVSICLAVLVLVGVLLMFNDSSDSPASAGGPGIHLMQAATFVLVAAALALAAVSAILMSGVVCLWVYKKHCAILYGSLFLLALWASFMSARTFVSLDNAARDSEVMFYLLNVLPLALVGLVFVVLRAPLLFNFEMTGYWSRSKVFVGVWVKRGPRKRIEKDTLLLVRWEWRPRFDSNKRTQLGIDILPEAVGLAAARSKTRKIVGAVEAGVNVVGVAVARHNASVHRLQRAVEHPGGRCALWVAGQPFLRNARKQQSACAAQMRQLRVDHVGFVAVVGDGAGRMQRSHADVVGRQAPGSQTCKQRRDGAETYAKARRAPDVAHGGTHGSSSSRRQASGVAVGVGIFSKRINGSKRARSLATAVACIKQQA